MTDKKKDEIPTWFAWLVIIGFIVALAIALTLEKNGSSTSTPKVGAIDGLMTCQGIVEGMGYVGVDWGSVVNKTVFPTGDINAVRKFTAKNAYGLDLPKTAYCKYRVGTGLTRATVE
jgi:hypothetical protein